MEKYAETVSGYVQKSTDDICVTKTITVSANQKPWLANEVRAERKAFKYGEETALSSAVLDIIVMVLLVFLLTLITGACPLMLKEKYVRAGDMLALYCGDEQCNNGDSETVWKKDTDQELLLLSNMSAAEQKQMGVMVFGNCFVILNASVNHPGNYSCDSRRRGRTTSIQFWYTVAVYTTQTKEFEKRDEYPMTCYRQQSCTLNCPHDLAEDAPNITKRSITWHKDGEPSPSYFPSVEEKDSGVYICKSSYLYAGQMYNMTFAVPLTVKQETIRKYSKITSPQDGQVFHVELGTKVVIPCEAITSSCDVPLFWLSNASFVDDDNQSRVFYRESCIPDTKRIRASLVFREVSEEDLSKNYTCKLQSDGKHKNVTITLAKEVYIFFLILSLQAQHFPSYTSLAVCVLIIVVAMAVTVVIYVKFKVDVILFLRDTLGCRRSSSDGKNYDAFLMCYKSVTNGGLDEDDRKWLESTLEERYGYNLCCYDRDVLPGTAVVEAVLECIEQSRTVVLVPSSPDPNPGSSLLSVIHAALVERQTRLIFLITEQADASTSGSFAEALHLLSEAGDCVTWKGRPAPSSFWKQLRYHLLAPQRASKIDLLLQTSQEFIL
ncbi:interleukin-18 receptor 1-like [Xenentodon cancila]